MTKKLTFCFDEEMIETALIANGWKLDGIVRCGFIRMKVYIMRLIQRKRHLLNYCINVI